MGGWTKLCKSVSLQSFWQMSQVEVYMIPWVLLAATPSTNINITPELVRLYETPNNFSARVDQECVAIYGTPSRLGLESRLDRLSPCAPPFTPIAKGNDTCSSSLVPE